MYDWTIWESMVDAAYRHDMLRETVEKGIRCNAQAARHGSSYIANGRSDLITGAIWSRMNGDPVMVMSCAGSGNKGLTSIVPVVAEAEARGADAQTLTRCVILSTLVTSLVTARFGTVSSACGVLYAAGAGLVAAFLFLRQNLNLFQEAYRNYISAVAGGFCDGAKGSCAMRGHSAVRNAMSAVRYAENGFSMGMRDGFLGRDFKETLDYLAQYNTTITEMDNTTIDILKKKERRQNC